jgi:hypothetical protein
MSSLTPEQCARRNIDGQLDRCGWGVLDDKAADFSVAPGIALRDVPLTTGPCDCLLLAHRRPVGVIEVKKEGTTLSGVADLSARYPFGKKSSVKIVGDGGQTKESLMISRDDVWASISNKQFNFLLHIFTVFKQHGRAAVVLPDNVLFGGGVGETVRCELLKQADVHTFLRLQAGLFYAQGVKVNVLFFDRKPAKEKPWTQKLRIDLRTNQHFTLEESTLQRSHLDEFVIVTRVDERTLIDRHVG